jgi:hypothetical protein
MSVEIDTATSHTDLFDRLLDFLQASTPGPEWELLDQETGSSALLRAHGLSELEQIYFGFSLHADVGLDTYAIGQWMFRDYNAALGHLEQPGHSGVKYLPVWNTSMPYWFVANGQRLMIAAKVSTVYPSSYAGKLLPAGTPGEYPQPYYLAAPVATATTRWSTISENDRAFFDPGTSALVSIPGASWKQVANFIEASGESAVDSLNYCWPYSAPITGSSALNRYRELRGNLDGTYSLWPIIVLGENPEREIYGELDGAYAVSGFNNAAENTVTIDAVPHLVVQNMHRTARPYYAAIKLE